jgi:hypothetical protein
LSASSRQHSFTKNLVANGGLFAQAGRSQYGMALSERACKVLRVSTVFPN